MTDIQNMETMEAQVQKVKAEQTRTAAKTLKNLDRLYEILNGSDDENSEEDAVAVVVAVTEPSA